MRPLLILASVVLFIGAGACGDQEMPHHYGGSLDGEFLAPDEEFELDSDSETEPEEVDSDTGIDTSVEVLRMWTCLICDVTED